MNVNQLGSLIAKGLLIGGLSVGSANAADLGGNCCADLEERIAELEATTVRKGNRKVSLTISGWVNQQVMFWDDGIEANAYIHDLGTTLGSHFKLTGSAAISPGWSAGYVLHVEALSSDGLTHNRKISSGPALYPLLSGTQNNSGPGIQVLQSYWFVKSEMLGKVSIGQQSQASDNAAILVDGSGSLVSANWVAFDVNNFSVRLPNGGLTGLGSNLLTWGNLGGCHFMGGAWGDCNGLTHNAVRYDSPVFAGFSVSASWGEDDFWDVAARYAGDLGGFKIAATAAYNEVTAAGFGRVIASQTIDYFQAGAYVQHVATGLFGLVNYGLLDNNVLGSPDTPTIYIKGGLRTRLSSLGATVFYGEFLRNENGNVNTLDVVPVPGLSSQLEVWGVGAVQEIDAAAMSIWIKYRNLSADLRNPGDVPVPTEDFNYVGLGALINF